MTGLVDTLFVYSHVIALFLLYTPAGLHQHCFIVHVFEVNRRLLAVQCKEWHNFITLCQIDTCSLHGLDVSIKLQ